MNVDQGPRLARRQVLGVLGAGGLCAAGLLAGPARADTPLDVRILQTASSLEALAEAAYALAAGTEPAPSLATFAQDSRRRHAAHKRAFQERTTALGGRAQDGPNPRFLPLVSGADVGTPAKVVGLLAVVEKLAVDTYLSNLAVISDRRSKELVAAIMAVGAQHLAFLRTAGAVQAQPLALPLPRAELAKLPALAGIAATPDARHKPSGPDLIAEPESGALG